MDLIFNEIHDCILCSIKNDDQNLPFKKWFPQTSSEILFESKNYFIVADIAQIRFGHFLIIHKNHIPSMAFVSPAEALELSNLKRSLREAYAGTLGPIIFFEHGAKSFARSGGNCIDHAHMHVVPINADIISYLNRFYAFNPNIDDQLPRIKGLHEYLYYENAQGESFLSIVANGEPRIPTQFFRRVLADLSGKPDKWNWRDHIKYPELFHTPANLKRTLALFHDNFDKFIQIHNSSDEII